MQDLQDKLRGATYSQLTAESRAFTTKDKLKTALTQRGGLQARLVEAQGDHRSRTQDLQEELNEAHLETHLMDHYHGNCESLLIFRPANRSSLVVPVVKPEATSGCTPRTVRNLLRSRITWYPL